MLSLIVPKHSLFNQDISDHVGLAISIAVQISFAAYDNCMYVFETSTFMISNVFAAVASSEAVGCWFHWERCKSGCI